MANLFRVDDKVAVVIGGAGGIGETLSHGLAEYGAKAVIIADIALEKGQKVAQDVQSKFKIKADAIKFDITDEKSVAQLAQQVADKYKRVDILVNSQGVNYKSAATEFPGDRWDFLFNINVKGTMLSCREFGKIMTAQKSGKVINLSSVRGIRATLWGGNEGYCATKGAIDMITRSLASEWASFNINVNAIGPAVVETGFSDTQSDPKKAERYLANIPLKRFGKPNDVVGLCIFLACPASDFITGQILYLDGGLTAIG